MMVKVIVLCGSIFFAGQGIEKIKTEDGLMFHFFGEKQAAVIVNHPMNEDDGQVEADAGEDISTCVGSLVRLTAAESYDPLSQELEFHWYFYAKPSGSAAGLANAETMNPHFIIDKEGEYYVTLEVKAEDGRTAADTVVVVAEDCNGYPTAVITTEKTVLRPGEAVLSARQSSCINDEIVDYQWRILSKPRGSESTIYGSKEASIVLDEIGSYRIRLTIRTKKGLTDSEEVELRCVVGEIPPIYAYSQELTLTGAKGSIKKVSVLIELPDGAGDLTSVTVYGKNGNNTELLGNMKIAGSQMSFSKVVDYFSEIFVVGMIDEKMVVCKRSAQY